MKKNKTYLVIFLKLHLFCILSSCDYNINKQEKKSNDNIVVINDTASFTTKLPPEKVNKIINSIENLTNNSYLINQFSIGINIFSHNYYIKKYELNYKSFSRNEDYDEFIKKNYLDAESLFFMANVQKEKFGVYYDIGDIEVNDINSNKIKLEKYEISGVLENANGYCYKKNRSTYNNENLFNLNGNNVNIINTFKGIKNEYQIYCPLRFDAMEVNIKPISIYEVGHEYDKEVLIDPLKPYSKDNIKLVKDTSWSYDDFIDLTKGDINITWNQDVKNKNGIVLLVEWRGGYYKEENPTELLQHPSVPLNSSPLYFYKIVEDNGKTILTSGELQKYIDLAPQYIYAYFSLYRLSFDEFNFEGDKYPIICGSKLDGRYKFKLK